VALAEAAYKLPRPAVAADFPYDAKHVEVAGETVAYFESGTAAFVGQGLHFIQGGSATGHRSSGERLDAAPRQ